MLASDAHSSKSASNVVAGRGFGADAPYADTIAAPSDKAYHLRQARIAKSFGFNFVRCHSHFLPPE